ncbi:GGDEF domain-containing protein [Caminibacter pacificus]|uniref:diguanylate cyclase n=1 Tax=Caminibacter pacificus TaxID=1424653 RepID=A0AAJ4REF3_9BACT|nr:GGDEF domain-containing protein [Caminibacter pacificus]NPA87258.1 GGDEF domain-containing protein [Campylobacterota bacterium]QCI28202.1 GGDEF domain-containing protein [Caminibacter pacificus]ROR41084.1 diguanylate cyclase (GGDEF)-like protein [Caminibacter pacificus]
MLNGVFLKNAIKDLLISIVSSTVFYFLLRYLNADKKIIPYAVSFMFIFVFAVSITASFVMFKLKLKINDLNEKLSKLAKFDETTDVYKRIYFFEMAYKYFDISKRKKLPLSVMIIDIDDFSFFNNKYGLEFSDKILHTIGSKLKTSLRGMDIIGRYGGDSFIIMSFSNKEELINLANRIRNMLKIIEVEGKPIALSLSIGITEKKDQDTLNNLIKRADEAVILAKEKGGNRVDFLEQFLLFE